MEIHAAGFETPHEFIARIDHGRIVPCGVAELVFDLVQCRVVVSGEILRHHLLFLGMRVDDAGAAGEHEKRGEWYKTTQDALCGDQKRHFVQSLTAFRSSNPSP